MHERRNCLRYHDPHVYLYTLHSVLVGSEVQASSSIVIFDSQVHSGRGMKLSNVGTVLFFWKTFRWRYLTQLAPVAPVYAPHLQGKGQPDRMKITMRSVSG